MSVLIRGMKMPESCGACPCFHATRPIHCQAVPAEMGKRIVAPYGLQRPDWCPLVEVKTPHGRLIDADEMVSLWKGCTFEGDITCLLDQRPTVLEAEE